MSPNPPEIANPELLTPLFHGAQNRCFGCGQANPVGLRLEFSQSAEGAVISNAIVSDQYEGPRGYLHGGIIATLLDEAMSKANRAQSHPAPPSALKVGSPAARAANTGPKPAFKARTEQF